MARYSPEQVRRRRRTVLGCMVLLGIGVLILVSSCTVNLLRGDRAEVRVADPSALVLTETASDAPATAQLPGDVELEPGEVMGIDVSSHQDAVDWGQVASQGYSFAYIKATEGTGYTDPRFAENWEGAKAAGVVPGAYHYFTLCSPGVEQARDFLAAAPPDDAALPPVLDLEFDGACEERPESAEAQQHIDDFTRTVEAAWGRRVVIYSSSAWRDHYGLPVADGRAGWLFSEGARPEDPEWAIWQLRFDGEVAGIAGPTDVDVLRPEVLREHSEITESEREALQTEIEEAAG